VLRTRIGIRIFFGPPGSGLSRSGSESRSDLDPNPDSSGSFHYQAKKVVLRIRDVYPGSWFLPIPDPGSRIPDLGSRIPNLGSRIQKQQQKREVKKISCHTFLCSHKFHKIVNYFSFEVVKKKIWANFQRIIELFTKKIVKKLLKIWSWDPGSGKNLFRIPDPGVKKAPDPGSRIPDPDPQHWKK